MRWILPSVSPHRSSPSTSSPEPVLPGSPLAPVSPPIEALEGGGLELSHLWRYLAVAALVATAALLAAWSRVDLVETSVALDSVEARLTAAEEENQRLQLELATVTDPAYLTEAAVTLQLAKDVHVVDVPRTGAVAHP